MQTFLPLPCFEASAKCLDTKRLGKQRVECLQLVLCLRGYSQGWTKHPAVMMWSNHVPALIRYGLFICEEWIGRDYKDTCFESLLKLSTISYTELMADDLPMPKWLGDERFHDSHKSNLLRKDRIYYGRFEWRVPSLYPYIWPGPG